MELGDVVELRYGKALRAADRTGDGFLVYGSNGPVGRHEKALTSGPTIVVGRKGSYGEVCFSEGPCWPIDTTYYIDGTCTTADLGWLSYRLRGLGLTELNRAVAIPGLNRDEAYRQTFLLPPVEEQRRIAAVLDAADELRALRRQALAALDSLTGAAFADIFRPVGWDHWGRVAVENVALPEKGSIRTGPFGSQLLHEEFVSEGIAVLGIDNAVRNRFEWSQRRYITPAKYEQLRRYTVAPGDVLVTIMGTCGRVAVVPDDIPLAINTKHLCCISVDGSRCLPEWLWACFRFHPRVLDDLGATHGAVMPGLNMGKIKQAEVPLPPIEVQRGFVGRKRVIERRIEAASASIASLDTMFASLQQRAFRGEL